MWFVGHDTIGVEYATECDICAYKYVHVVSVSFLKLTIQADSYLVVL